ncbi:MAG: BadF/BadG/BcrA/BcrD ATPase family protein, partial [Longimicrobiales bacterium]
MRYTAGIDVGSTYTKCVVVDADASIVGKAMRPTGFRLGEVALEVLAEALAEGAVKRDHVAYLVTTGFGRHQVPEADTHVTDLTAAARGAALLFPGTATILDVGGQTMKATRLGEDHKVKSFRLNDK